MKTILEYQDFPNENRKISDSKESQCYICKEYIPINKPYFESYGFYSDKGSWYTLPNFLYITICPKCRLKVKHGDIKIEI